MGLEQWKSIVQIGSYLVAAVASIWAIRTYVRNSRRDRARWTIQLFEKFYEVRRYRKVRDLLDGVAEAPEIRAFVDREPSEFTDYLNFFELVIFLVHTGQLEESDVLGIFQYYLGCLQRHTPVMAYLNNKGKGFERLSEFLNKAKL